MHTLSMLNDTAGTEEKSMAMQRLSAGKSSHSCRKVPEADVPCLASFCDC